MNYVLIVRKFFVLGVFPPHICFDIISFSLLYVL